ncbi:MAG: hypothetical protein ACTHU0_25635, partial [Kofleriaceae bacterium]
MKTTRLLSSALFLTIAAAGCAAERPDDHIGPPDDDDVNNPPDDQPVPTTPEGRFAVQSKFDLATNLPGTAGTVIDYFISATDDPEDPTKFIVEQVVDALPNGSIKDTLRGAIPFVAGYLNDRLLDVAPDFVTKIVDVGDAFGQVTKNFGLNETLDIKASGSTTKTVEGLHFKIDNVAMDFPFADFGIAVTKIEGLTVALAQTGKLTISQHAVPLKYGQVLKIAIDEAIIPLIDPSASNLGDLLHNVVDCEAVGRYVYEAIDIGSPSTFESACNSGLTFAASALYGKLDSIDGSLVELQLTG